MTAKLSDKNSGKLPDPGNSDKIELFSERELLHALINNIPDFIYIKDRSSKFILANQKMADIRGLMSGDQLIGTTDYEYYPRELANQFFSDEQEVMASGNPLIGHEEKGLDEEGYEIYVSTTKIPLKDRNGNIIGIVGIGRDITDFKLAELNLIEHSEKLQQVNTLLEEKQEEIKQQSEELTAQADNLLATNLELQKLTVAVSETENVVLILDAEGNFEWVNKSFARVYGQSLEEYTRKHGKNILEGSHNPQIREIMAKCRDTGKTVRYQSEEITLDANKIWTQSTLTPVFDDGDKIIRFIAIDADITALKKAQEMIDHQKSELEARGKQLEKANLTKDKFFSIIAHDLKNPFHSILGFSDLISKNYYDITDEKKREYLGLIHESSQNANTLLDNLLNWSRTQTDTIRFSPSKIELHSTIVEIHRMLHSSMEKKNIHFEHNIPGNTYAFADSNMIQTVLRNLISNAIKFTPDNGTIEISAEYGDDRVIVKVRDTGIGIREEQQKKLFNFGEFYSTDGTEGEQGTGLGLLICHEFAKKHGGNLSLKSKPGMGTTFSFDIPAREPGK